MNLNVGTVYTYTMLDYYYIFIRESCLYSLFNTDRQ